MTVANKGADQRRLMMALESITERLDPAVVFEAEQPLEVELGSGDGSFLVQYACAQPGRNFIGVERLLGRARKIERKGLRAGLRNLAVVRLEAGYFTGYLLPPGSVSVFHIYFPDPWPKKKHRRHRLINERFAGVLARALVAGGRVFTRTDDPDYHCWIQEAFASSSIFRPTETPAELAEMTTDFEQEFNRQGIATLHTAWRRQA